MKWFWLVILQIFCSAVFSGFAQAAFHNFGNIQIHDQGKMGIHMDLTNDGNFDKNLGMAGFYHADDPITVSGSAKPVFYDLEIDVQQGLFLNVGVGVNHFQEFINGRVITPRDKLWISLDYDRDAPYLGANDSRHVDGYASITGDLDFWFPIGDDFRLRPMKIEQATAANTAKGAYFFENPNFPNFFSDRFKTENLGDQLNRVSIFEFWDLDGDIATPVSLTWDDNSNIPSLVENLSDLRVVGWDSANQIWVNLGNAKFSGDFNQGEITSDPFLPNDYTVLTIGASNSILDGDLFIYTGVTPNGDGVNDYFRIDGLGKYPNNEISIFNRWGVLVYKRKNYHRVQNNNEGFSGKSEGRVTILKKESLPTGTYYYVLKLNANQKRAGYLYIN